MTLKPSASSKEADDAQTASTAHITNDLADMRTSLSKFAALAEVLRQQKPILQLLYIDLICSQEDAVTDTELETYARTFENTGQKSTLDDLDSSISAEEKREGATVDKNGVYEGKPLDETRDDIFD